MDRQAWIVVTLCIIGLIAWQFYMAKHPAPAPVRALPTATPAAVTPPSISLPSPAASPVSAAAPNEPAATPTPFVEKTVMLKNQDLELLMTNRGGAIAEAVLPRHRAEDGGPVRLGDRRRLPIGAIVE